MRNLKLFSFGFLFLLLGWLGNDAKATHLMGVDITYECINACTIRVALRVYRDCGGASGVSLQQFNWSAPSAGCALPTPAGPWVPGSGANDWVVTEVTPVCPGTITQCNVPNSPIRGVEEYFRYRDYNICNLNCTNYTIEWWGQNRNGGITSGAANQGLGSFVTTFNPAITPCNSSPQFNSVPVPYICQGQPFTFNQGATDPDGDSLSYALGPCFDDQNNQVNYNPGYSPTSPLGPSWAVTMNAVNGDVTFTPQPGNQEVGVMCVYVSEWRNGQLINVVGRDIQINVIPCPSNSLPAVPNVGTIQNGTGQGNSSTGIFVAACLGDSLCIDIPVVDPNSGDTVTVWWDQSIPGATFTQTGNPNVTDTIIDQNPSATFCWTPPNAGNFSFLVEMQDNACPNFGFSAFTVNITVSNPAVTAIPSPPRCDTIDLCAFPTSGIAPFTYQWSGQGGLSSNDSCVTHVYPNAGTYPYTLTITDSVGCTFTYVDSVVISQIPVAFAGPDILECETVNDTLGGPSSPDEVYTWTPSTGLSDPNVSNPAISLTNPGPGPISISYALLVEDTVTGCSSRDTVIVTLSFPAEVSFDSTNVSCYSGSDGAIDMTISGGLTPLTIAWTGPGGFTSANEDINNLIAGTYIVTITDFAGCETIDSVQIEQPDAPLWANPQVVDVSCAGGGDGSINMVVTGGTQPYTYQWSTNDTVPAVDSLTAGTYSITVTDSIGCTIVQSVTINEPTPISIAFTSYPAACNGDNSGILVASASGGHGNYGYLWTTVGSTDDSISNLGAGLYPLLVTDTFYGNSNMQLFFDDFEGYSPWILNVPFGTNGDDNNFWTISDAEGGVPAGQCAVQNNGNNSLHIASLANPTGGAVYDLGGACGITTCPETNMRAESPFISSVGFSNLTVSFDFTSVGDAALDNASVWYNDGTGWNILNASIKSGICAPSQGQWASFTATLPASCDNIPNLQIGIGWSNNDDGIGNFPSIAVNDVLVTAAVSPPPVICIALDTGEVTQPAPLGLVIGGSNNPCFGDSLGSATATPSGGNGNYGYTWSTGAFTPTISGLPAGTYTVTVTDTAFTPAGGVNGFLICTAISSITITEPTPVSVAASTTPTSCFLGSDGTATAVASGGTPGYTFVWNTAPPQTGATITGLSNGAYTVIAIDTNGCIDSATTVVNQPTPVIAQSISMTNATCGDPTGTASVVASGGVGGYTYAWNTTPTQNTSTAVNLLPGNYVVTITDANGCQGTGSITVGNEPNPDVSIVSQVDLLCFGDGDGTITAQGSGGTAPYDYFWSNGQTGPTAVNLIAGTYTVTVVDQFGCEDTVSATIVSPPEITSQTFVQNMGCMSTTGDGEIGVIASGGRPGYTYSWSTIPPQTGQVAAFLDPGIYFVTVTDANGCTHVTSDTVVQIPRPDVTAGPDVSFCEGEGGAQINATATGGSLPYYYTWYCGAPNTFCGLDSINDNDPIANPDTSGWFYVFVVDGNGCVSDTDSVFVEELPKPYVDVGEDIFLCGDSAPCVVLNPVVTGAGGPYIYDWGPGAGLNDSTIANPCARPDTTTIYTLVVTAANGCTSELNTLDTNSTITVHVNPIPIADAGPDRDICFGDSAILQGTGSGAGPNYEFQWTPGVSLSDSTVPSPFAFPDLTSDYALVVYSNGCPSYADTVTVTVHPIPTVVLNWNREICLGDTTILDGIASGDTSFTYQWWPTTGLVGDTTAEDVLASPDTTTTYYFTATTQWGCESAPDSALLTVRSTPIAEAGPNLSLCEDDSIQLQGSFFYTTTLPAPINEVFLSWNPADQMSDSTIATPTIWPDASGWYYLTVRHNVCETEDSVFVTLIPRPEGNLVGDTTVICGGDSIQLTASGGLGGATFTWLPPVGLSDPTSPTPTASPDTSTTYILLIEEGGCFDTLTYDLDVIPNPEPSYISSLTDGCVPHSVSFIQNSANALNFVWDFGDGSPVSNEDFPVHTYTTPGSYNVTLTAINTGGCQSSISDIVVNVADTISANFTSDPRFPVELALPDTDVEFTSLVPNATSHLWDFGDGRQSTEINPFHNYQQAGTYMVELVVENEQGCQSRIIHGPYIVATPELFIPNVFSPNADGINDGFLVEYSGSQAYSVTIFDRWGVQVFQTNNKTQAWLGTDQAGEEVPEGTYFYLVKIRDKEYTGSVTLVR